MKILVDDNRSPSLRALRAYIWKIPSKVVLQLGIVLHNFDVPYLIAQICPADVLGQDHEIGPFLYRLQLTREIFNECI